MPRRNHASDQRRWSSRRTQRTRPTRRRKKPKPSKNNLKETQDRLQAFETENEALRRRNDLSKQTIHTLTESLAVANAECEVFRRQYSDLKLRMEALGLASVGDNKEALEQRLLKAVRDLKLLRDEKDKLAERMVALSETVLALHEDRHGGRPANPDGHRGATARRQRSGGRRDGERTRPRPRRGRVDERIGDQREGRHTRSCVIGNLGSQQGVKIGMPFLIVRGNHLVARARVVDVREKISGAIIEEYGSNTEKVKVGDTMRVDVQS